MTPCGQGMDLIRSCYQVLMRLQEGADPVPVTWSFCKKGADLIGVPTPFGSANWNIGEDLRFDSYLGEQAGPRPWRNGQASAGLAGKRLCFPLEYFRNGVPAGVAIDLPTDRSELPLCCQSQEEGIGGVVVNGTGAMPPPPPFNCLTLPDSLSLSVTASTTGCNLIAQNSSVVRGDPGSCIWDGTIVTLAGVTNISLSFSAGTWHLSVDCFLGQPMIALVNFTQDPLQVVFSVTDTAGCCNFGGTDMFLMTFSG